MNSADYEPVYFSRLYGWKNDLNMTDEEYNNRIEEIAFVESMWSQFLDLMRSKNVNEMALRQAILMWLNDAAKIDYELHDFDRKIRKDVEAHLHEDSAGNLR